MGAKIKRTGKRPTAVTQSAIHLVKQLPEKHAKGAAVLASQLAPRSQIDYPGYVHLADSIKAKNTGGEKWEVDVGKEYGIYVEMGTVYMEAIPFFRPAIASAQRAMRAEMRNVIAKARR
jgi:HK97 gp10 family phage protein